MVVDVNGSGIGGYETIIFLEGHKMKKFVVIIAAIVFVALLISSTDWDMSTSLESSSLDTGPPVVHYEILREFRPHQIPNSLGLDLLVGSNISKTEIITLLKTLSKDKDPVRINIYTDHKVYKDSENNIYGDAFDEHFLLCYIKNLTARGVYYGSNEIRWMQERGKFKDLSGSKTRL